MRRVHGFIGAAAVLAISGSALGNGQDLITTFNNISPGVPFAWSVVGQVGGSNPGVAGCFNFTRTGGSYTGVSGNYISFCTELTQTLDDGQSVTYKVVNGDQVPGANGPFTSPLGLTGADLVSELFGRFFPAGATGTAENCASFQLAIWEIVYDSNLIINGVGDTFQVGIDPLVLAQSQFYLNSLDGTGPRAALTGFTNALDQDQIIPAPGALGLLGLGALVVGRRRR
jgi:hypothetical protein